MKKILLGISLLWLAGCATPLEYDRSTFSINSDVELAYINAISTVRERDGQVFVQVTGMSPSTQMIYYKTEWFDKNGMKISTDLSKWKTVKLIENMEFTWKITSPSKRAVTYKIHITDDLGDGIIH